MIQPGLIDLMDMLVGQAILDGCPESKSKKIGYRESNLLGRVLGQSREPYSVCQPRSAHI